MCVDRPPEFGSYNTHIKAIDVNLRKMFFNMGPLSTGGPFKNQYTSDIIRKSRARNDKKKESARIRQLHDDSYSMDDHMEIEDSVPIVLEHYLKQIHAACIALPLLKCMYDSPEVLVTTLHEIAVQEGKWRDDEQHTEPSESESSESWAYVLSSASALRGSPYKNLVDQLFITPFRSRDAFQIQNIMAGKLLYDMGKFKNVLPYTKDSDHALKHISMEVDQVEQFMEINTEYTSHFYDWKRVLAGLEKVTQYAIYLNDETEFEYNGNTLEAGVLEAFSDDAEDLGSYPDVDAFTPSDAFSILQWRCSDLDYFEILGNSLPAEILHSQHLVDGLFSTGTNHDLTLKSFKCKANVQTLYEMDATMAYRCYDILHLNDWTEEADAYLAEFKNVLMSHLPGVCEIEVSSLGEVHGLNVIKLTLKFVGLGEVKDLHTYMTISPQHAANYRKPIHMIDVNLLLVRTQGAGMIQWADDNYFVEEVLDALSI